MKFQSSTIHPGDSLLDKRFQSLIKVYPGGFVYIDSIF